MTLKRRDGESFPVKVGERVNLERLKKGDEVMATYTEAVAISVQKADR